MEQRGNKAEEVFPINESCNCLIPPPPSSSIGVIVVGLHFDEKFGLF